MRIVVPDQRNVPPGIAGAMVTNGAVDGLRDPAERDHRLGKHDPDLVHLLEAVGFSRGTAADHGEIACRQLRGG